MHVNVHVLRDHNGYIVETPLSRQRFDRIGGANKYVSKIVSALNTGDSVTIHRH